MNFGMILLSAVAATPAYPSFLRFEPGNKYFNPGMRRCIMLMITLLPGLWIIAYGSYVISHIKSITVYI